MRQVRWASGVVAFAMALAVSGVSPATADVTSDRAAAILMWPDIFVWVDGDFVLVPGAEIDTVVQLSNTSQEAIDVHCFYENANSHCTNTGEVCFEPIECCDAEFYCGICKEGWNETDFRVRLTPRQPLGWQASQGRYEFPLSGAPGPGNTGPDGSSNAGSRIPPVPEDPFNGVLKCIAVNPDGTPSDRNVLKGEAKQIAFAPGLDVGGPVDVISIGEYNAVGVQAIPGAVNEDNILCLGGEPTEQCPDGAEYNGCPNVLILNHFFDGGLNPVLEGFVPAPELATMITRLVLVPCTQDLLRQIPGQAIVQYLVYNEFEQRFSTSRKADCKFDSFISSIDTNDPLRSIFSAGVSGTLSGQTRMNPIGSGMLGMANEIIGFMTFADFNIHFQGDRGEPDVITLPTFNGLP